MFLNKGKNAILLFLMLMNFYEGKAEYGDIDLPSLVCSVDFGDFDTIVGLDENYFYLWVEKYINDSLDADTLKIQRFEDWGYCRRYDLYEIGQREFVFFIRAIML
jgi:hypothetical protein